jgi:catechol-2,3-dioxygenase
MKYHQGRLIDHIHLRVSDIGAAKRFYRTVFEALGRGHVYAEEEHCFFADELQA